MKTGPVQAPAVLNRRRLHASIVAALVLALTLMIFGGYGLHWSWTGFEENGTAWDWLKLFVLPVTLALLPVWQHSRKRHRTAWRWTFGLLLMVLAVFGTGGYAFHWAWTGVSGRTLWDWLEVFLVSFVLPLAVAFWSYPDSGASRSKAERDGTTAPDSPSPAPAGDAPPPATGITASQIGWPSAPARPVGAAVGGQPAGSRSAGPAPTGFDADAVRKSQRRPDGTVSAVVKPVFVGLVAAGL